MKEDMLFREIGSIGEDLIAEGGDDAAFRAACRGQRRKTLRTLMAACVALVLLCLPLARLLPRINVYHEYSGSYPTEDYLNGSSSMAPDLLDEQSLLATALPASGSMAEGVVLSLALPDSLSTCRGLALRVEADGLLATQGPFPSFAESEDSEGAALLPVSLLPQTDCTQGELTLTLYDGELLLWQQTLHYQIEGDRLLITEA